MIRFVINMIVSSLLIATAAEVSRRSNFLAALLISLPLTSMIALSIVYVETGSSEKVAGLSTGILLLVIPSLIFFVALTFLLKHNLNYWVAFGISSLILVASYSGYSLLLKKIGINV